MDIPHTEFTFEYTAAEMHFGRNCVAKLDETLETVDVGQAMIVCGKNVGANAETMDPITEGMGDRLGAIFDETTPEKTLETVLDGVDRMEAEAADGLVAVGGGSSLNVARAMAALSAVDQSRSTLRDRIVSEETVPSPRPGDDPVPIVSIPTTLAGADVSSGGTIRLREESIVPPGTDAGPFSVRVSDPRLFAKAIFYDQELFASTPTGALVNSAMNGFNKGIETLYSRETNPISDAHAFHGLRHLATACPDIPEADADEPAYDHLVAGIPLVQYGRYTNIIHTFGNGINHHYDTQQGVAHAIMVAPVLEFIFERVDGRRREIAAALDIDVRGSTDDEVSAMILDRVHSIRDALGLPTELRSVRGIEREHLPALAQVIAANPKQERNPHDIDPTVEDIEEILEQAW